MGNRIMRKKHYFWNMKHHRQLDEKMGLLSPMAKEFAELDKATGGNGMIGGTKGDTPLGMPIFGDKVIRKSFGEVKAMPMYDYNSNEIAHRFYRSKHFDLVKIDDGEIDQDGRDRMGFKRK